MARVRHRPAAQVLPHHERGAGPARCTAETVAGCRRHPEGNLPQSSNGMTNPADHRPLEDQITQWRSYLRRRRAINGPDVEELESHLRDQVMVLTGAGLAADEAFLVAVKR